MFSIWNLENNQSGFNSRQNHKFMHNRMKLNIKWNLKISWFQDQMRVSGKNVCEISDNEKQINSI